jgi:hypothetical protein
VFREQGPKLRSVKNIPGHGHNDATIARREWFRYRVEKVGDGPPSCRVFAVFRSGGSPIGSTCQGALRRPSPYSTCVVQPPMSPRILIAYDHAGVPPSDHAPKRVPKTPSEDRL